MKWPDYSKTLVKSNSITLTWHQVEHTPFDAVDDGFDYFSSAFLWEEVDFFFLTGIGIAGQAEGQ